MKRSLAIDNHVAFHLTTLRTVLAGGLYAVLHSSLSSVGWLGGTWTWLSGVCGVLILGAAAVPTRSRRELFWLGACSVLGSMATGLSARWTASDCAWASALPFALAVGLSMVRGDLPRWQLLLGALAGTLCAWGGQLIPRTLNAQDWVLELPTFAGTLLGGMGVGLVVGSATIVRHLKWHHDPVDQELRGLLPPPNAEDEIAKLVMQAMQSYQQAAECLDEHPQARTAAEDLVKKIARFGKKWQDIESQAKKSDRAQLAARLAEIQQRQDRSTDESVRSEYERAQTALRGQLEYLTEIDKGRERAVARLHHQVATLERLRLAALRHRSVGATKLGEDLRTVVDDLAQAGQDLDTASEVLAELSA